jgi:hypothetical protein
MNRRKFLSTSPLATLAGDAAAPSLRRKRRVTPASFIMSAGGKVRIRSRQPTPGTGRTFF